MNRLTSLPIITDRKFSPSSSERDSICFGKVEELNRLTIELIKKEIQATALPWCVGFSGGKDSSALLKLVYRALYELPRSKRRQIDVVYCDTGVEIPVVASLVGTTLRSLELEAVKDDIPLKITVAQPLLRDRFFVKVIGRGYPPPTNKFRWCTDRLRIKPVQSVLKTIGQGRSVVLLGIRRGESLERDRTIQHHASDSQYYLRQHGSAGTLIFSPIINYSLHDVWATIVHVERPVSIDSRRLTLLYRDASGDCPIVRDPRGSPCGKGRFGCWTCTVVRKDRAVQSLVSEGYSQLKPLLEWRDWMQNIRDDKAYRCSTRRNGQVGLGPFTLDARRELLSRLLLAQESSGWKLIGDLEIEAIKQLWETDLTSSIYRE
ncbi:MAG: DNA phosphorothioation system sulfurtransferase DndC [Longimicrobiaceae bacterium]